MVNADGVNLSANGPCHGWYDDHDLAFAAPAIGMLLDFSSVSDHCAGRQSTTSHCFSVSIAVLDTS